MDTHGLSENASLLRSKEVRDNYEQQMVELRRKAMLSCIRDEKAGWELLDNNAVLKEGDEETFDGVNWNPIPQANVGWQIQQLTAMLVPKYYRRRTLFTANFMLSQDFVVWSTELKLYDSEAVPGTFQIREDGKILRWASEGRTLADLHTQSDFLRLIEILTKNPAPDYSLERRQDIARAFVDMLLAKTSSENEKSDERKS